MATIGLRLAYRAPLTPDNLYGHLIATGVPGVEEWRDGAYRRTLRLPHGPGIATLRPTPDGYVDCRLALTDLRDLSIAISRCRRTLDLDADPVAVDEALRADPVLRPLVAKGPGRRVPRTTDGPEFAIRAVLGQQVSTAAARTHASRLVQAYGEPVDDPGGGLTHLFPAPAALAAMDPAELAFPQSRRTTLLRLAEALATDEVDLSAGSDWTETRARLAALPGIGPWTVEMIAMRALGDPDAFPATDLGVRYAARDLGLPDNARALADRTERVAALARLRGPVPVGHRRPRDQPDAGMRAHAQLDSPVGPLILVAEDDLLTALHLDQQRYPPAPESLGLRDDTVLPAVREQLAEYFAGDRTGSTSACTSTGRRSSAGSGPRCRRSRSATTTTYGELAAELGRTPAAARAIGSANGRNPVSIVVPCHRLVGSTGALTGYGGGLERKRWLLAHERAVRGKDWAFYLGKAILLPCRSL